MTNKKHKSDMIQIVLHYKRVLYKSAQILNRRNLTVLSILSIFKGDVFVARLENEKNILMKQNSKKKKDSLITDRLDINYRNMILSGE